MEVLLALTIIFGFMVFLLILKKCNFLFVGVISMLIIAAISLGVGYGAALLIITLIGPVLKIILAIICIFVVLAVITGVLRGGSE